MLLLANDGTNRASTTTYTAALGGWAAGGAAQVTTGVYGLSSVAGGIGVVGSDTGTGGTGKGMYGLSITGTGVYGSTASTSANAAAIYGVLSSATPGSGAAAVRGQNNATSSNGVGVYGLHEGSGYGAMDRRTGMGYRAAASATMG